MGRQRIAGDGDNLRVTAGEGMPRPRWGGGYCDIFRIGKCVGHYRQKLELEFSESGIHYIVKRRRELDIEDGKLIGILDTYVEEDPYHQRIVE